MSDNISIKMALLSLYGLIQAVQKQQKPGGRRPVPEEAVREDRLKPIPDFSAEETEEKIKEEALILLPETLPEQPVVQPEMKAESEIKPEETEQETELLVQAEPESEDILPQSEPWEDLWKKDWKQPVLLWDDRLRK